MICYVLAIEKQNLGPHVVVGYGIKIFRPGLFITSPDHLGVVSYVTKTSLVVKEAREETRQKPAEVSLLSFQFVSS